MGNLRAYQVEAKETVRERYLAGVRRMLLSLATGLGKTVIFSSLVAEWLARRGGKAIVFVHRDELADQTVDKMRDWCPGRSIGVVKAERNELGCDITVCGVDTIRNAARLAEVLANGPYTILVVDEAHHAAADSWKASINAIMDLSPDTLLVGFTATPGRADGRGLDEVFAELVFQRDILFGIQNGHLTDIQGKLVELESVNLDKVAVRGGDFSEGGLSAMMASASAVDQTVQAWLQHAEGLRTIAFCVDVAHAEALGAAFRKKNVRCEVIKGDTTKLERRDIYARFRRGEVDVLSSCLVLTEGFDEPSVRCILLARPTLSQPLYVQMVGRGVRPDKSNGKTHCVLLDITGVSEKHSLVSLAMLAGLPPVRLSKRTGEETKQENIIRERMAELARSAQDISSFSEWVAKVRSVDLVEGAFGSRQYDWVDTKYGHALDLGDRTLGWLVLRKARGEGSTGLYNIVHVRFRDGWRIEARTLTKDAVSFEWAIGLSEQEARRFSGGANAVRWKSRKAEWQKSQPTDGQKKLLKALGVDEILTRGQAARVITSRTFEQVFEALSPTLGHTEDGDFARRQLDKARETGELDALVVLGREEVEALPDKSAKALRQLLLDHRRAEKERRDAEKEASAA